MFVSLKKIYKLGKYDSCLWKETRNQICTIKDTRDIQNLQLCKSNVITNGTFRRGLSKINFMFATQFLYKRVNSLRPRNAYMRQ